MLLIGRIVRQKIRTQHLHNGTCNELEQELLKLKVGMRANQFVGSILDFMTEQTKDLENMALGSTEIIESAFGKMKQLMDEDSKDGFTPFVLSLAACLGKLDLDTVQEALKSCNKQQVKAWAAAMLGKRSIHKDDDYLILLENERKNRPSHCKVIGSQIMLEFSLIVL